MADSKFTEEFRREAREASDAWRPVWDKDSDFVPSGDGPEWEPEHFAEALHVALDEIDRMRRETCEAKGPGIWGDLCPASQVARGRGWPYLYEENS